MKRNWDAYQREQEFLRQDLSELLWDDANPRTPTQPKPTEPPLVIKPGSHWAAAAYKAGREDEWINAMQARYGDLYD